MTAFYQRWLRRLWPSKQTPSQKKSLIDRLRDAEQEQLISADGLAMLEGVLQLFEMRTRDVMVPTAQVTYLSDGQAFQSLVNQVIDSGHSRYPVIGQDKHDKVKGILHAKDLLAYFQNPESFDSHEVIREAVFVPESQRLHALLRLFRMQKIHMAMVTDEYGNISGIVTMEDILEQIVGKIEDEFDIDDKALIKKYSKKEFIVKAITSLDAFNAYFQSQLAHEHLDTIGGFLTHQLGHVPAIGEEAFLPPFHFKIIHAKKNCIELIRVILD